MKGEERKKLIKILEGRIHPHVVPDDEYIEKYAIYDFDIMNSMILLKMLKGEENG